MSNRDFTKHRNYVADLKCDNPDVSIEAYRALGMANNVTLVVRGQLELLSDALKRLSQSTKAMDINKVYAVADTLDTIVEDLRAAKDALEVGMSLIESGKP